MVVGEGGAGAVVGEGVEKAEVVGEAVVSVGAWRLNEGAVGA